MRNFCLIISLLLLSAALQAQVPGFMGKRFTVFLEGNPTPALFVQNANNQVVTNLLDEARTDDVNKIAFTFRPQVTAEYLVSANVSLGFSYSRISVGTTRAYQTATTSDTYMITQDVVKGQSIGVHFKLYRFKTSASIPPIGFYKTLSVYLTQTNTYDTKKSTAKQFKNDFVYPVGTFGIGRQTMIAKNLLLKTGAEFGWAFVPMNWLMETEDEWNVQEYAGYNVHRSLSGHYIFTLNVALGYTLF
jgi:hypothetical protein